MKKKNEILSLHTWHIMPICMEAYAQISRKSPLLKNSNDFYAIWVGRLRQPLRQRNSIVLTPFSKLVGVCSKNKLKGGKVHKVYTYLMRIRRNGLGYVHLNEQIYIYRYIYIYI